MDRVDVIVLLAAMCLRDAAVLLFLPGSPIDDARAFVETVVGARLVGLVPDEIDRVCDGLSWARCDQAEEKSDVQIARDTGLFDIRFEGEIWVAPEASFAPARAVVEEQPCLVPVARPWTPEVSPHGWSYGAANLVVP